MNYWINRWDTFQVDSPEASRIIRSIDNISDLNIILNAERRTKNRSGVILTILDKIKKLSSKTSVKIRGGRV